MTMPFTKLTDLIGALTEVLEHYGALRVTGRLEKLLVNSLPAHTLRHFFMHTYLLGAHLFLKLPINSERYGFNKVLEFFSCVVPYVHDITAPAIGFNEFGHFLFSLLNKEVLLASGWIFFLYIVPSSKPWPPYCRKTPGRRRR